MGRVKTWQTYESRLIDIDILFYDDLVMDREELKIPHPENQKQAVCFRTAS